MNKSFASTKLNELCVFCGKKFHSESDNFCSKTCSQLHDITESIQNILFCVELLKKDHGSKSNKKINHLLMILENNSFNISDDIRTLRS